MPTKLSQLPANQQIAWAAATPAVTVSTPLLDAQQTWNAGAVTFTGLKLNITDTASASASKLIDLQVATVSQFNVNKTGDAVFGSSLQVGSQSSSVATALSYYNGGLVMGSACRVAWTSGAANGTQDVTLFRDAANTLALRNGVSAQTFNVYNTYTDASNYERVGIIWASNVATLTPQNAGTGSARLLVLVTGSTTVASLPAASAALTGARAFVTDANASTFATAAAGGGANKVPVWCDGAAWKIG